jgi:alkylated DNA repair dioxygenase AlkB
MQLDLVAKNGPIPPQLPDDLTVEYVPDFVSEGERSTLFRSIREGIPWQQDHLKMFGKTHPVPRLHQWFADDGLVYRWSGLRMVPVPWPSALLALRQRLHQHTGLHFDTCLANLYRDGKDTVGWHADDEPELGPDPVIASVSLGATRDFVLRSKATGERVVFPLTAGSLLVMGGATQRLYEHSLPRRKRVHDPRINLTFRRTCR